MLQRWCRWVRVGFEEVDVGGPGDRGPRFPAQRRLVLLSCEPSVGFVGAAEGTQGLLQVDRKGLKTPPG